ncbi:DMT family transporter [Roseobacter weihaiensis]|uniref:DMT family transporter n=1 Tax=Roseobacter weihaiensis TaxID=2763262 RepID=UPI001D0B5493|nr:DMT family transporter [Roseobacter sp. H9]
MPQWQKLTTNQKAILIMVAASALIAATSLIAKALGDATASRPALHPLQVSAGRFCFALSALLVFLLATPALRPSLAGAQWTLHLMRSLCGWLGVTAMFAAVARMPVGEATAISFLSPIVTLALAALMLGERVGARKVLAAGLALVGAVLILRPGSDAFQLAGLLALAAAALMGLEAIFIKRLTRSEPALRILVINNMIGAVLAAGVAAFVWQVPTGVQWLLLICLGVVMVCGQALFLQSMKRGDASLVMPAFYAVLVFAALFDFLLYQVVPSGFAFVGAALIVLSAVFLARMSARGTG